MIIIDSASHFCILYIGTLCTDRSFLFHAFFALTHTITGVQGVLRREDFQAQTGLVLRTGQLQRQGNLRQGKGLRTPGNVPRTFLSLFLLFKLPCVFRKTFYWERTFALVFPSTIPCF